MCSKINFISHSPSHCLCMFQKLFRIIALVGWFNNAITSCLSFLHNRWFSVHPNRLQIRMGLDKKPAIEINPYNPDRANCRWNYCWLDLSSYNTWIQFSRRQSTRVFRELLDWKGSILEFTASNFYSNLFIFFSVGVVFVDKVPSKNKN